MATQRFTTTDQTVVIGASVLVPTMAEALKAVSAQRVAVFISPSASRSPLADQIESALSGVTVARAVSDIRPHALIDDTEGYAEELCGAQVDAIVTVGGGSVSDTGKAVAILLAEGGRMADHCTVFTPPDSIVNPPLAKTKIPVIAVPTTFSAAEITPGGGATTADGLKRVFWDPHVASRYAIFDLDVLGGVPSELLLTSGMNAIAHCAEGLYSRTANSYSTGLAREAAKLLTSGLVRIVSNPGEVSPDALADAASGAALSGLVITNARVGLHHAICHVLGAKGGLSHGVANSVMLPYVLRYNADVTVVGQATFLDAVREGVAAAGMDTGPFCGREPSEGAAALQRLLGVPASLAATGLDRSQLAVIADEVMQDRGLYFNPKVVEGAHAVLEILEAAWAGA